MLYEEVIFLTHLLSRLSSVDMLLVDICGYGRHSHLELIKGVMETYFQFAHVLLTSLLMDNTGHTEG